MKSQPRRECASPSSTAAGRPSGTSPRLGPDRGGGHRPGEVRARPRRHRCPGQMERRGRPSTLALATSRTERARMSQTLGRERGWPPRGAPAGHDPRAESTSSFPSSTAPAARTAPSRASPAWPACPASAPTSWARPSAWTRTRPSGSCARRGYPVAPFMAFSLPRGRPRRAGARSRAPGRRPLREARQPRLLGRRIEGADRGGVRGGGRARLPLRHEGPRREDG